MQEQPALGVSPRELKRRAKQIYDFAAAFESTEKLLRTPNTSFRPVERVRPASFASNRELARFVNNKLYDEGVPVVLEDTLREWRMDEGFLTPENLSKQWKDLELSPRNMETAEDMPNGWTVGQLLHHFSLPPDSRNPRNLYGKDVTCPEDWVNYVATKIPNCFVHEGDDDAFKYLPVPLKAENIMIYIGTSNTWTPIHVDICASIGHNQMVYCDDGASSLWFMSATRDKEKLNAFLDNEVDTRVDFDNTFIHPDILSRSPVPIYVIEQKAGDFVLIPPNGAHQVLNIGSGISLKLSWNRLTPQSLLYCIDNNLRLLNHICKPEIYRIKTALRYTFLAYSKFFQSSNVPNDHIQEKMGENFKCLYEAYSKTLFEEYDSKSATRPNVLLNVVTQTDENAPHTRICDFCTADIFNRWFHCEICEKTRDDGFDTCIKCAATGRSCKHRQTHKLYQHFPIEELVKEANFAVTGCNLTGFGPLPFIDLEKISNKEDLLSPLTVAMDILQCGNLATAKCHQCNKPTKKYDIMECSECRDTFYCGACLFSRYGERLYELLRYKTWRCHVCKGRCNCEKCKSKGTLCAGKLELDDAFYKVFDGNDSIGSFFDHLRIEHNHNSTDRPIKGGATNAQGPDITKSLGKGKDVESTPVKNRAQKKANERDGQTEDEQFARKSQTPQKRGLGDRDSQRKTPTARVPQKRTTSGSASGNKKTFDESASGGSECDETSQRQAFGRPNGARRKMVRLRTFSGNSAAAPNTDDDENRNMQATWNNELANMQSGHILSTPRTNTLRENCSVNGSQHDVCSDRSIFHQIPSKELFERDFGRYLASAGFERTVDALVAHSSPDNRPEVQFKEMFTYYRMALETYGNEHPIIKAFCEDAQKHFSV